MNLPDSLHHRRYPEWNYLVRGLMEVWDLFRVVGLEAELERHLAADIDGELADMLGRIGNSCASLAAILSVRVGVLGENGNIPSPPRHVLRAASEGVGDQSPNARFEELVWRLDMELSREGPVEQVATGCWGSFRRKTSYGPPDMAAVSSTVT